MRRGEQWLKSPVPRFSHTRSPCPNIVSSGRLRRTVIGRFSLESKAERIGNPETTRDHDQTPWPSPPVSSGQPQRTKE